MKPAWQPLVVFFRAFPQEMTTELLTRLFNHFLQGQSIADELQVLNGRRLTIEIVDFQRRHDFIIKRGRLYRSGFSGIIGWDVCIRGKLEHFWQLASRQEDPDTLFFNRQLEIEGDTETGLYVKNLLDSLDYNWADHFQAVLGKPLNTLPGRMITSRFQQN